MADIELPTSFYKPVDLGIIGGTGLYNLPCLNPVAKIPAMKTPWGHTSSPITISEVTNSSNTGTEPFYVAFISRHGETHQYPPSKIPSRANIAVLKHLDCKAVLSFSAVGSLRQEIKPRDFVIPQQIIDRTKGIRPSSYLNEIGLVGHVMFGTPFSKSFAEYIYKFRNELKNPDSDEDCILHYDEDKTVICMEGPAFSTRAESRMYRQLGGDIINMSVMPEAVLARECELPYQMICMSTDYDAWKVDEDPVNVESILGHLKNNSENANLLVSKIIESMAKETPEFMNNGDGLRGTTLNSIASVRHAMSDETVEQLKFIFHEMKQ